MRTNIDIDTDLIEEVRQGYGLKTKREAVDLALRYAASLKAQEQIIALRGKLRWEGDLDAMRTD